MAIAVGTGGFNTGRDASITLIGPYGRVDLENITSFQSAQKTAMVNIDTIEGEQMNAELPKGWTGSLSLERGSPALDALISQVEQDWLVNGNYLTGTLYLYVTELPGTAQSTFEYTGLTMKLSNAGTYKSDSTVPMTLDFTATTRNKIT
jgi:hypothetical protein